MKSICVYCGANPGHNVVYQQAAKEMGRLLAERGITLVYGAGNIGLMGTVADAALQAGGKVIGVIPQGLMEKEVGHQGLTELYVVDSMHTRKAKMAALADAFIAMPGGFGTLEELAEIATWTQLGFHKKPLALLNVEGFYDKLLAFFDHAVAEGFLQPKHRQLIVSSTTPEGAITALADLQIPELKQWLNSDNL